MVLSSLQIPSLSLLRQTTNSEYNYKQQFEEAFSSTIQSFTEDQNRSENVDHPKFLRWPTKRLRPLQGFPLPYFSRTFSGKLCVCEHQNQLEGDPTSSRPIFRGLKKVEIEDDRVLQISRERNVEKEDKNDMWHRVERSSEKFMRRFRLLENVKMEDMKASMGNGVLTVTIPKEEVKKPDVKAIEIFGLNLYPLHCFGPEINK